MQRGGLTNSIEIFNSLVAQGHCFSVHVSANLTSFGILQKYASGDVRRAAKHTHWTCAQNT